MAAYKTGPKRNLTICHVITGSSFREVQTTIFGANASLHTKLVAEISLCFVLKDSTHIPFASSV